MDDVDVRVREATANNIDEEDNIAVGLSRQLPEHGKGDDVFVAAEWPNFVGIMHQLCLYQACLSTSRLAKT